MTSEKNRVTDAQSRDEKDRERARALECEFALDVPEEETEVPSDALGTASRLWSVASGQRWRLVVAALCSVLYVAGSLGATAYSAGLVDLLWENIQTSFAAGAHSSSRSRTEESRFSRSSGFGAQPGSSTRSRCS